MRLLDREEKASFWLSHWPGSAAEHMLLVVDVSEEGWLANEEN